jgi:hypothetical protein
VFAICISTADPANPRVSIDTNLTETESVTRLKLCATILVLLLSAHHAQATGSFACTINDANMTFEAASPMGRGMGSPILHLVAKLEVKDNSLPEDLAKLDLKKALVHSWVAGDDFNLHFYHERDAAKPHGFIELIIKTKLNDDAVETSGSYDLITLANIEDGGEAKTRNVTGAVVCAIE